MSKSSSLEQFFLRLFKGVILFVMTLSLLVTVGALGYAAKQFFQTPQEPEPAKTAPSTGVDVDKFLKSLEEKPPNQEPKTEKEPTQGDQQKEAPSNDKYKTEASKLIECSKAFNAAIGAQSIDSGNEAIEDFRLRLQRVADLRDRGQPFAEDAAKFTCAAFSHPKVIEYGRSDNSRSLLFKVLNFHIEAWDDLKREEREFNEAEQTRAKNERSQEEARVAVEKARTMVALGIAGAAFVLMMILALYLIFSAIESNLRRLSNSIDEIGTRPKSGVESPVSSTTEQPLA